MRTEGLVNVGGATDFPRDYCLLTLETMERFGRLRYSGESPTTGLRIAAPISAAPISQVLSGGP